MTWVLLLGLLLGGERWLHLIRTSQSVLTPSLWLAVAGDKTVRAGLARSNPTANQSPDRVVTLLPPRHWHRPLPSLHSLPTTVVITDPTPPTPRTGVRPFTGLVRKLENSNGLSLLPSSVPVQSMQLLQSVHQRGLWGECCGPGLVMSCEVLVLVGWEASLSLPAWRLRGGPRVGTELGMQTADLASPWLRWG